MFKTSLILILSWFLLPLAHGMDEPHVECGRALAVMNEPTFSPEWDFTAIRTNFEHLEKRAREEKLDGAERRVLSSSNVDIDIGLNTREQRAEDRKLLYRPSRVAFSKTPDRRLRFKIKSEAALNAFIKFVVQNQFAEDQQENPLFKFMDFLGTPKLEVIFDGWPIATSLKLQYVGGTESKLIRHLQILLDRPLPGRRDWGQLMIDESDSSHWDLRSEELFRLRILKAEVASTADGYALRRWRYQYLMDHYQLDLAPLDTYFGDVAPFTASQIVDLLGIHFEPFTREIKILKGWPESRLDIAPEFVAQAIEALKKLIKHGYVWVEPSRQECRGQHGQRPCGWITRAEFDREWPFSTAHNRPYYPDWSMYHGQKVPRSLSLAVELARTL